MSIPNLMTMKLYYLVQYVVIGDKYKFVSGPYSSYQEALNDMSNKDEFVVYTESIIYEA